LKSRGHPGSGFPRRVECLVGQMCSIPESSSLLEALFCLGTWETALRSTCFHLGSLDM
jgi:hypothetical protein